VQYDTLKSVCDKQAERVSKWKEQTGWKSEVTGKRD